MLQPSQGPRSCYRGRHMRRKVSHIVLATYGTLVTHSHRALALLLGVLLPKEPAPGRSPRLWRFGRQMSEQFRFCPPPEATPQQVIPIVLKFPDDNPKALDLDIRDVANYVGRLTWPPCK